MNAWIANELKGCEFPDKRLNRRFKAIMEQLSSGIGRSLPLACQDWTNTKAAYWRRKLKRYNVSDGEICSCFLLIVKYRKLIFKENSYDKGNAK